MPLICMAFACVPLAKASHRANPRVRKGENHVRIWTHEGQIHWKSFLLQSDMEAESGDHREPLGGFTIIQKRDDDRWHQGDDNGSFKECLDSECALKDNFMCILLSH